MKKTIALLTLAFLAGLSPASAKEKIRHAADPEFLHSLLVQKLSHGVSTRGPGIVIDIRHPDEPISKGWHYMDAWYCGWYYNGGNPPEFYAYDGNTVLWDVTNDPMLATALSVPCIYGNRLGYHVTGAPDLFHYDKTESFTYQ